MILKFSPGDRIVLARVSEPMGDYGINTHDYGRHGVVVAHRYDVSTNKATKYCVLLEGANRRPLQFDGRPYTWNVTEDQLDWEEGPW